jgi:hypothetical protein
MMRERSSSIRPSNVDHSVAVPESSTLCALR